MIENNLRNALTEVYPVNCKELVFSESSLVRYSVGAKVPRHTDVNKLKRNRVISFVLYLTDNFCGGRFHIPSMAFAGIAPLGASIVFPSSERHFADVIEWGDKSVLVGFFETNIGVF